MTVGQDSYPSVRLSAYRHPRPLGYFVKRFAWACVQLPFWPKMPRMLSPLRIFLLRLFGAQIAKGCRVTSSRIWVPWNLKMEEFSVIGDGAEIYNLAPIQIGANSVISQKSYLCTATHDYTKPEFPLYSRPINIGASAWVAADVFVGPGINIGEGAVVGARSVVTKDIPPWTVCAGNPCRVIKHRILQSSGEDAEGTFLERGRNFS